MFLVVGVVAGILEARTSGQGQVVDVSMVDGSALLMSMFHSFVAMGMWSWERGTNLLDSGAHCYDTYECADRKYVAVGALEAQFYAELLRLTGQADEPAYAPQMDRTQWPALTDKLAVVFKTKTRAEWCEILEHSDACFAPVLSMAEAFEHPHNVARGTFTEVAGVTQAAPAPRFSRTPGAIRRPPPHAGQHTDEALADWGFAVADVAKLREIGAVK
jgi:alpha-methylacyl-CoA racemase